jgi:hypothetical protein
MATPISLENVVDAIENVLASHCDAITKAKSSNPTSPAQTEAGEAVRTLFDQQLNVSHFLCELQSAVYRLPHLPDIRKQSPRACSNLA